MTKRLVEHVGSSTLWGSGKSYFYIFAAVAALLYSPAGTTSAAATSSITVGGRANFWRSGTSRLYRAVYMSGRYRNRGYGRYWTGGRYSIGNLYHRGYSRNWRSGSLSFEFWGTPFYGGSRGFILRTRGFSPLNRGWYYSFPNSRGPMRKINRWLWPAILNTEWSYGAWRTTARRNFGRRTVL